MSTSVSVYSFCVGLNYKDHAAQAGVRMQLQRPWLSLVRGLTDFNHVLSPYSYEASRYVHLC
jgi:2-keto-4-pentenoate hydratase/2-oxohepta-3-ene-1,7-dioic acid hydratase in catechol pathway